MTYREQQFHARLNEAEKNSEQYWWAVCKIAEQFGVGSRASDREFSISSDAVIFFRTLLELLEACPSDRVPNHSISYFRKTQDTFEESAYQTNKFGLPTGMHGVRSLD